MFNRINLTDHTALPLHMLRIRFADDAAAGAGSTAAGSTAATADAAAQTAAADKTASSATAGQENSGTAAATADKVEDLPAWAQKLITDTRTEAAGHRTAAKTAADNAQQALTDKIAVALGLKTDAATDPAALTASLTKAQQDARTAAIKLGVYQNAAAHQGNPDALLDSNTFLASVSALDPTAADFTTQVSEAIKAAVTANPTLKAARAAGASSVETPGGTGEIGQITDAQLAQMTPDQINEAFEKGQLKHLLG